MFDGFARFAGFLLVLTAMSCRASTDVGATDVNRDAATATLVGGSLTHFDRGRDAYARPAPGLSVTELRRFGLGNRVFSTRWVVAPASVSGFDGLGPVFNRDSCSACHMRDGRGRPPESGSPQEAHSSVVKISARRARVKKRMEERFGTQINTLAIAGVADEGSVRVVYESVPGQYSDGVRFELRRPRVYLHDPLFDVPGSVDLSMRVAPSVFGLGLVEALPNSAILEFSDPDDDDGDGISGRPNWVTSTQTKGAQLGRFGWKAKSASLADQSLDAAIADMGLTTREHPQQNCAPRQAACRNAYSESEPELSARLVDALVSYLRTLGVPARSLPADSASLTAGFEVFTRFGCAACHRPMLSTDDAHPVALLRDQVFFPFSDFLLHDMGTDLAGGGSDGDATDREWRTPPLWGLSLLRVVNGHNDLMHDGRARSIEEAVLWHGGEGSAARESFRAARLTERQLLVDFVQSL